MSAKFIEVHVLQWFPLSCINRDDAGLPKSMPLGGERRARWSSQSQKYALRKAFPESLDADALCMKTRRLPIMALEVLRGRGREEREAAERIVAAMGVLGFALNQPNTKAVAEDAETDREEPTEDVPAFGKHLTGRTQVILPVSQRAHLMLADAVEKHWDALGGQADLSKGKTNVSAATKKAALADLQKVIDVQRLVDVALFGRFLAEVPEASVDGTCSVSHAFTTHPDDYVSEFWSAVDDDQSSQGHGGSANMGTQGLTAGTFYRYGVVDLDAFSSGTLSEDPALVRAGTAAFVREFIRLRPRAMVHGTAPYTDPALVLVTVTDKPRMLGDAFVRPVDSGDYLADSAHRLLSLLDVTNRIYGGEQGEGRTFILLGHPDVEEANNLHEFPVLDNLDDLVETALGVAFDG